MSTSARIRSVGIDGWLALLLTAGIGLSTAGLTGLWALLHVWRQARGAPSAAAAAGDIVVLGLRPNRHGITAAFKTRLARAANYRRRRKSISWAA